jgi:hypothetical protein
MLGLCFAATTLASHRSKERPTKVKSFCWRVGTCRRNHFEPTTPAESKPGNGMNEMEIDTSLKSLAGNRVPMISNLRLASHGGKLMLIINPGVSSDVTISN